MEWQPLNSNSGVKNEDDEEILCGNVLPYIHWDCCGGSWVGHDLGAKTYVPLYGNETPEVFQKCHQKIEDAIRLPRPLIYLIIAYFLAFDHLSGLCPSGLVLYRVLHLFHPFRSQLELCGDRGVWSLLLRHRRTGKFFVLRDYKGGFSVLMPFSPSCLKDAAVQRLLEKPWLRDVEYLISSLTSAHWSSRSRTHSRPYLVQPKRERCRLVEADAQTKARSIMSRFVAQRDGDGLVAPKNLNLLWYVRADRKVCFGKGKDDYLLHHAIASWFLLYRLLAICPPKAFRFLGAQEKGVWECRLVYVRDQTEILFQDDDGEFRPMCRPPTSILWVGSML